MRRIVIVLLVVVPVLAILSSCALRKPVEGEIPFLTLSATVPNSETASGETQSIRVTRNETIDGRILQIDAEVTLPDWNTMATIQLGPDAEKESRLVEDWILSKYPETKPVRSAYQTDWMVKDGEEILESLTVDTNNVTVNYLNVTNDINSDSIEKDDIMSWIPHYITELRPPMLEITADEAAKESSTILEQYSCFTYSPWNVTALDAETTQSSGAYSIKLQPLYDGFPIFGSYSPSQREIIQSCEINAWMSDKGLFCFYGTLPLKELDRSKIERVLSLDHAVEKIIEDFPIYAIGQNVRITRICAAYDLQGDPIDATCTLIPGWAFECVDSDEHSLYESYYTCFYALETGEFHLIKYL